MHFLQHAGGVRIWMDMVENGEIAFQTSYELVRVVEVNTAVQQVEAANGPAGRR